MGGGVVVVLSFAGSITASATRVVRASVHEQGEHGGGLVLVGTAEEGFGATNEREGLAIP